MEAANPIKRQILIIRRHRQGVRAGKDVHITESAGLQVIFFLSADAVGDVRTVCVQSLFPAFAVEKVYLFLRIGIADIQNSKQLRSEVIQETAIHPLHGSRNFSFIGKWKDLRGLFNTVEVRKAANRQPLSCKMIA